MNANPHLRRSARALRAGYAEREVSTVINVALLICN
jgi:hypothetical protein